MEKEKEPERNQLEDLGNHKCERKETRGVKTELKPAQISVL